MPSIRSFGKSRRRLLVGAVAALGLTQLGYAMITYAPAEAPLDAVCAGWDHEASIGVALLVPDHTDVAGARLDYALHQLKRARNRCRHGRYDLARQYYEALVASHPFPGRQARATSLGESR